MEFGRVPDAVLNTIDFSLPDDPPGNIVVLGGRPAAHPRIYIGCARWGCKEWVGQLFPAGTRETAFLQQYTQQFNSVELNATHYKIYEPAVIRKWVQQAASADFRFCPKFFKGITHGAGLLADPAATHLFLDSLQAFEGLLGPAFIQLSDSFGPQRRQELFQFLSELPRLQGYFVELRHAGWFEKPLQKELLTHLQQLETGLVITDTPGRSDCRHMQLTSRSTMIRFVGHNLHPTDYTRCDAWVSRVASWMNQGLEELYFFMHMKQEETAPVLALYLAEQMEQKLGITVMKPRFQPPQLPQQTTLF